MAVMPKVVPVQCRGHDSLSVSVNDQQEKYGSCVTSGTAGGRIGGREVWADAWPATADSAIMQHASETIGFLMPAHVRNTGPAGNE
jgi:hypothetical protein